MRFATPALAALLLAFPAAAQEQVTLSPIRDTSIYEESGALSNGAGAYLFAGETAGGNMRRALLAFDVSSIPSSATITGVSLALHMSKTATGAQTVRLHRLLQDWGEGTSNADANEGQGATATTGDATWTDRFFGTSTWDTPGGVFEAFSSANVQVGGIGSYTWAVEPMIADVQGWIDGTHGNFGWILVGAEGLKTAKRFDSRENPTEGFRPVLTVTYTTGTAVEDTPAAAGPTLAQNWPNPFGARTEIAFTVAAASHVRLEVYDLLGRRVATLVDARLPAGTHTASFEAAGEPAGIYLARLQAGERVLVRQMARM